MTLIVGIRCTDGVVIGADGAITVGNIVEPIRKLHLIEQEVIMGVSGPLTLSQFYTDRVKTLWSGQTKPAPSMGLVEIQRRLQSAIFEDAQRAIQLATLLKPLIGDANSYRMADSASLLAVPARCRPELIQCDLTGTALAATDDLPYFAVGSGGALAVPFLAFFRDIFWPDNPPGLSKGILSTVWTLTHAIRVKTWGVAGPIQVAVLSAKDGQLLARELGEAELQAHQQAVSDVERYLSDYLASE